MKPVGTFTTTSTRGIIEESKRISAISSKPSGHSFRNPAVNINIPTTTPMLKMLEPNRSPTDNEGVPAKIAKTATKSSGVDVMTERRAKPTEVSLRPANLMKSSTTSIT